MGFTQANQAAAEGDPITAVRDIVFSLGALTFYYLLYAARLVPDGCPAGGSSAQWGTWRRA
jgi:hypothetical protein